MKKITLWSLVLLIFLAIWGVNAKEYCFHEESNNDFENAFFIKKEGQKFVNDLDVSQNNTDFTLKSIQNNIYSDSDPESVDINFYEDEDGVISSYGIRTYVVCPSPEDISVDEVTFDSADLSWTELGNATEWKIFYDPAKFDTDTEGTTIQDYDGYLGETIMRLDPQTEYDVSVRSVLGADGYSAYDGSSNFLTNCETFVSPFYEDFESDSTPQCWTESGDNAWKYSTGADYAASDVVDHTPGNTNYAWMDGSDNTDGDVSTLTSPAVDISTLADPALLFYLFSNNTDDDAINLIDVEFYDGADWNDLLNLDDLLGDSWVQYIFDLSSYNITGPVKVRFTVTGQDNGGNTHYHDVLLDDVKFLEMLDCTNPTVVYDVVSDCEGGGQQFLIDVNISDMGGADVLEISDNLSSSVQTASSTGTYTFGPYPNGTDVVITIENTNDSNCAVSSSTLGRDVCAPENDSCDGAFEIPVNMGQLCQTSIPGTLNGATLSAIPMSCPSGNASHDVWFKFTATSETQMIALFSADETETEDFLGLNQALYEGNNCDDLTQVYCNDDFGDLTHLGVTASPNVTATDLNIGETYYLRVFAPSEVDMDFNVCITTPNYHENGTCGNIIPFCAPTDSDGNQDALVFSSGYYYLTQEYAEMGPYYDCTNNPANLDFTLPNPAWYYIQVQTGGDLELEIVQNTAFGANGEPIGKTLDVDFTSWGPFDSIDDVCGQLTEENHVPGEWGSPYDGCDYSPEALETMGLYDTQAGEIYVVIILNYSENPGYISIKQTNSSDSNAGSTNCSIVDQNQVLACEGDEVILETTYPDQLAYIWYEYDPDSEEYVMLPDEETGNLTVTESGMYKLVSYNDEGRLTVEYFTVVFSPNPDLSNLDDEVSLCNVGALTLDGTPANPGEFGDIEYQWSDENGLISGETNATLVVTQPGTYSIEVMGKILDSNGYVSDKFCSATKEITVVDADYSVDLGGDQFFCNQDSYDLTANISGDDPVNASYTWTGPNGPIAETTQTISVSETGVYTVMVDIGGCTNSSSVYLGFSDKPEVDLGDDLSLCGVDSITLDAMPANAPDFGNLTYTWSNEDGVISGETDATLVVDTSGTYTVEVEGTVLDGNGNPSGTSCMATATVEVNNSEFTVNLGENQNFCDQETYELTAEIVDEDPVNATYDWEGPNGSITETSQTITVSESGTYTVVVDINGCTDTDSVDLDFDISPNFDLDDDITTCSLDDLILDATPSNYGVEETTFEWNYNGEPIAEIDPTVNPANYGYGTYTVTVYADNPDCDTEHSITIEERNDIGVNLIADTELTKELKYCKNGGEEVPNYEVTFTATLDNASEGEVELTWFKNDNELTNVTGSTYTENYDDEGNYTDTYTVQVDVGSCGASSSLSTEISIEPYEHPCKITKGLSPGNRDGVNDYLDLTFISDRSGIAKFEVFNRYGRKVYEKNNYVNQWFGQSNNGDELITGTYFYILEMKNEDPVFGKTKRGWIYINRKSN